ncbi:MAG: RNA methyltransferase [Thermosphaera sp.]
MSDVPEDFMEECRWINEIFNERLEKVEVYFVLNGSNEELAIGELKALLETYDFNNQLKCTTMVCTTEVPLRLLDVIMRRSGFLREAGIYLGEDDPLNPRLEIQAFLNDVKGWIHASVMKKTVSENVVAPYLSLFSSKTRLGFNYSKGCEVRLLFSDNRVVVGVKTHKHRDFWTRRGRFYKPFDRSIALNPRIAVAMVNLARVRPGHVLIDPFAGTGTIPIIASFFGIASIGIDLDWSLAHGMLVNLKYYGSNAIPILGDSTTLALVGADAVVTDPPYGRGASTHGESIHLLYSMFIHKIFDWVKPKAYAVFIAPSHLEYFVEDKLREEGLYLVNKYYDYVHSSLTRAVYVVRHD